MGNQEASPVELRIYVINLDRRPDRLAAIQVGLEAKSMEFIRLSAVDGKNESSSASSTRFLTDGLRANWASHQKALSEFLASTATHALILEDDAEISSSEISESNLEKWIQAMKHFRISMLQVGYISHLYSLRKPRGLLDLAIAVRAKRLVSFSKPKIRIVLGEYRAGAHAYIIDRLLASELIGANVPAYLASDNFLESLARYDSNQMFGRLFTSAVEQQSRVQSSQKPDSDV